MRWWRRRSPARGRAPSAIGRARRVEISHLTGVVLHLPQGGPAAIRGTMRRWVVTPDGITRAPDVVGVHVVGVPLRSVGFIARRQLGGLPIAVEQVRTTTWRRRTRVVVGDPDSVRLPFGDDPPDAR
ncbi:hypothetical protein [Euzebya sp.]|uniref:hypothetical protein n=1 Tax=Euzebya sp. TaxID=1971409 RepID=UPI00351998F3